MASAALTGSPGTLVVLWIAPAMLPVGFFGFAFDYPPHRPQEAVGARIRRGAWLRSLPAPIPG